MSESKGTKNIGLLFGKPVILLIITISYFADLYTFRSQMVSWLPGIVEYDKEWLFPFLTGIMGAPFNIAVIVLWLFIQVPESILAVTVLFWIRYLLRILGRGDRMTPNELNGMIFYTILVVLGSILPTMVDISAVNAFITKVQGDTKLSLPVSAFLKGFIPIVFVFIQEVVFLLATSYRDLLSSVRARVFDESYQPEGAEAEGSSSDGDEEQNEPEHKETAGGGFFSRLKSGIPFLNRGGHEETT